MLAALAQGAKPMFKMTQVGDQRYSPTQIVSVAPRIKYFEEWISQMTFKVNYAISSVDFK
jgi:hypothetical protein